MFKHSVGIGALGFFLLIASVPAVSFAQTSTPLRASSERPATVNTVSGVVLDRPTATAPLLKTDKPIRIRVGPVKLDQRNAAYDAPWTPVVPFFQRPHRALNLSFNFHWKER